MSPQSLAALRGNVNAMFVNLSRRSQSVTRVQFDTLLVWRVGVPPDNCQHHEEAGRANALFLEWVL